MIYSLIHSTWQQAQSWFSQAQDSDSDHGLVEIPDILQAQLMEAINDLSSPEAYRDEVQGAIATAIEDWQHNLDAPNSLVFLSNPVEAIAKILSDSICNWHHAPGIVIVPLDDQARPRDPLSLTQQIQQALSAYPQIESTNVSAMHEAIEDEDLEKRTTICLLPCLEQYFLRCIGGWDGIEYLREIMAHNRNCFWVVGCNQWAWEFLDMVCQISAYFNNVQSLPKLDGPMLQDWLNPIVKTVVDANNLDTDSDNLRQSYWKSLSNQSSGVGQIAVHLWLQSLRIQEEDNSTEKLSDYDFSTTTSSESSLVLHEVSPSLPHLPTLTNIDRYLLHSLLIHGPMSRPHLALSLGEPESQLQSRIQLLLREGVLSSNNGHLAVQASHYSKLKTELGNNNFFVSGNE